MREIKFRAWHKVAPKADWGMTYWSLGTGLDRSVFYDAAINNGGSIMQYTGLLDKNGKEIYEGDIVRHVEIDRPVPVAYDEISCGFTIGGWDGFRTDFDRAEVIGNVHENPELL